MRWIFEIDPRRNAVVRSVHLKATTAVELLGDRSSLWRRGWGAFVRLSASSRLLFQQRFAAPARLALSPGESGSRSFSSGPRPAIAEARSPPH
jgi:hypothetical protein